MSTRDTGWTPMSGDFESPSVIDPELITGYGVDPKPATRAAPGAAEPAQLQIRVKGQKGRRDWINCPSPKEYADAMASGIYDGRALYATPVTGDVQALADALRTIAELPMSAQDNMLAANMRIIARSALGRAALAPLKGE